MPGETRQLGLCENCLKIRRPLYRIVVNNVVQYFCRNCKQLVAKKQQTTGATE